MKTYNYFYDNTPITKQLFLSEVPENWENDIENDEYSWGAYKAILIEDTEEYTYDVHFNDNKDSNSKGWKMDVEYCKSYINDFNGTSESYFEDYKGGTVSVVCNETGEEVYSELIK